MDDQAIIAIRYHLHSPAVVMLDVRTQYFDQGAHSFFIISFSGYAAGIGFSTGI
jgi:hypothetical protein